MREIKFRAWDKESETMVHPKGILFDGRIVNFSCGMLEPYGGYKLMQWTGLKDVNGEEIYEGDIVECFVNGNSYVSFKGGTYGLIFDYSFIPFSDVYGEMKVIGNIYEDKHLLDGDK